MYEIENEVETTEQINVGEEVASTEPIAEVYKMLCGYHDKTTGITHTDFEIEEMNGETEEAISNPNIRANGSKVVSTVLEKCVTRIGSILRSSVSRTDWKNIISDLYVGDQDYMMLKIRETSVGNEIEANHKCPNCEADLKTFVKTSELNIKPFGGITQIPFELPKGYRDSKGVVYKKGHIRLVKGFDREILDPLARKNLGLSNTILLTRVVTIDGVQGQTDAVFRSLSLKDREYLLNLLADNMFGVELETEVSCTSCGTIFKGSMNQSNFM